LLAVVILLFLDFLVQLELIVGLIHVVQVLVLLVEAGSVVELGLGDGEDG
jgi:hypothetical protein